jgi:hypothetical protein
MRLGGDGAERWSMMGEKDNCKAVYKSEIKCETNTPWPEYNTHTHAHTHTHAGARCSKQHKQTVCDSV